MADTGWLNPADLGPVLINALTDPENVFADDASVASAASSFSDIHPHQYGASLPAGATIDGFEVMIDLPSAGTIPDVDNIQLRENPGGQLGTLKGDETLTVGQNVIGGPTDLWGWDGRTVEDVNADGFGFWVRLSGSSDYDIDWCPMKIYYTENIPTCAMRLRNDLPSDGALQLRNGGWLLLRNCSAGGGPFPHYTRRLTLSGGFVGC